MGCPRRLIIGLFGLLLTTAAYAITLTRGPYTQLGYTNTITIIWKTDVNGDSWVDYGLTPAYGATVGNASGVQTHVVTLTNLQPGTNYCYRIASGATYLATPQFQTSKLPGTPFRFVMTGDSGSGSANQWNVATRMRDALPDLAIHGGDIVYDNGEEANYDAQVFQPYGDMLRRIVMWPVLGNHDIDTGNGSPYLANWYLPTNGQSADERSYSFEYGDAFFLMLHSNGGQQQSASWVESALAASSKPWKIVTFHHPARTTLTGHGEDTYMRDTIGPVLERQRVNMVLQAHNHHYERIYPINGVHYVLQGAGGKSLYGLGGSIANYSGFFYNSNYSYTAFDINGPALTHRTYDQLGNFLDEVTVDKDCAFTLDGLLDSSAKLVANRTGGVSLWAAIAGRYLYVATQDAGSGNDNFILLNDALGGTSNLWSWSKSGTVMKYDAFVADENDNQYSGWFKSDGNAFANTLLAQTATRFYNDGVLEGVIDLQNLYGTIPPVLYLAGVPYGTANGGGLVASAQCPAGNGDGNVDSSEFVAVNAADITLPFILDGRVDRDSYLIGESNGMKLWAAVNGETLYVATWSPGNYPGDNAKNDHFILVTDQLAALESAFPTWSKVGMNAVSSTKPFLGGESTGDYAGWQQTTGTVSAAKWPTNSGQLEGTIHLREAFGSVPQTIYIAVAPYNTADGGALVASAQVPAGNGNGNIDADEFLVVPVNAIRDENLDGTLDSLDPTRGFVVQSITATGSVTTVTWPSVPARKYRVYSTESLGTSFQPLSSEMTAAQGQFSMSYPDGTATSQRIYRVHWINP